MVVTIVCQEGVPGKSCEIVKCTFKIMSRMDQTRVTHSLTHSLMHSSFGGGEVQGKQIEPFVGRYRGGKWMVADWD